MNSRSIIHITQAFIMTATLAVASLAMAEPTMQDVNQALKSGDAARAETMMKEVLAAHPESAKAHFKYSEILAYEGRLSESKTELSKAEQIEPGLPFAKPEAVNNLKHKLSNNQHTQTSHQSGSSPLLLWGGIALVGFLIFLAFRAFRRPPQQSYINNPQITPNGYGPQGGYPQGGPGYGPQGGGMGSGIMGGLATGAAVGAGIVAGEVLMHKILDDDHPNANHSNTVYNDPQQDNLSDISGNDFVNNDNGSWDNDSFTDSSSFDSDSSGDWS